MKGRKSTIIAIVLSFITVVGGCIYFVSGVSAVYPPIQTFKYSGSTSQFVNSLDSLAHTYPWLTYYITDTVGSEDNHGYYMTMKIKTEGRDEEYNIAYEKTSSLWQTPYTEIRLVGVFDKLKNMGGYHPDASGVSEMATRFDRVIASKLFVKATSP